MKNEVSTPNHRVNNTVQFKPLTIKALKNFFYSFTKLPKEESSKAINFGYTFPIDHQDFVIHLMERYVGWMDGILDSIPAGTDDFANVFGKRGFTLGEFKLVVMTGKVKEEHYDNYRVFDYFYLTNQAERDYYSGINTKNESELKEAYIESLKEAVKNEIPILNQFFFHTKMPLHIDINSLQRHAYILGMSGSGKSNLLKSIIYNLQRESCKTLDKSIVILEPHGDVSTEVLGFCLNRGRYKKRLIYLDPYIRDTAKKLFNEDLFKQDYTFTINPFDVHGSATTQTISYLTQQLSSAVFEILKSDATNQMEAVIEACIETLLSIKGTSISDLKLMMDDEKNEHFINLGIQNQNRAVAEMMQRFKTDGRLKTTKSAIYYRLQSLISDTTFRRLLVGKSTINLEREINNSKVIIFNLSKSKMGLKSAPAFGKLIVSKLFGEVLKRQDLLPSKRMETYFFIDEFHNYLCPSIDSIMAESRKYGLSMILANQVIAQNQMDRSTKRAILGNTVLKFAGENESDSIEVMAKQMNISPERFSDIPKYSFLYQDKANKVNGTNLLRVPDFLVHQKPPFYMKKEELKDLFKYLVYESGYYKPVDEKPFVLMENPMPTKPVLQGKKELAYTPNFEE